MNEGRSVPPAPDTGRRRGREVKQRRGSVAALSMATAALLATGIAAVAFHSHDTADSATTTEATTTTLPPATTTTLPALTGPAPCASLGTDAQETAQIAFVPTIAISAGDTNQLSSLAASYSELAGVSPPVIQEAVGALGAIFGYLNTDVQIVSADEALGDTSRVQKGTSVIDSLETRVDTDTTTISGWTGSHCTKKP